MSNLKNKENIIMIKSISFDEQEILRNILLLHGNGHDIELDPTFSKGNFYKHGLKAPKYKFDIKPQIEGCLAANAENLPQIDDNSINVMIFDPPFLATKGKSLDIKNESNKITKRFGVYPTEKELHNFYIKALVEFYRILKPNGILIFKCQDKVSSSIQYFSHTFIQNQAEQIGFYAKDLFILLAKNRIVADWQLKNQQHARKFHSYYWIFSKIDKKVNYI